MTGPDRSVLVCAFRPDRSRSEVSDWTRTEVSTSIGVYPHYIATRYLYSKIELQNGTFKDNARNCK